MNIGELFVRMTADASGVETGVSRATRSLNGLTAPAAQASAGMNSLKAALGTVATQALGVNPALGRVGVVLSSFALSGGVMAAALVGLAALAKAWELITKDSREAKEALDEVLTTLDELAKERTIRGYGPGGAQIAVLSETRQVMMALATEIKSLESGAKIAADQAEAATKAGTATGAELIAASRLQDELTAKRAVFNKLVTQTGEISKEVAAAQREGHLKAASAIGTEAKAVEQLAANYAELYRRVGFTPPEQMVLGAARLAGPPGAAPGLPRPGTVTAYGQMPGAGMAGGMPALGGINTAIGDFIGGLKSGVMGLAASFGPLALAAAALKPVFEGMMEVLGPLLSAIAEPLRGLGKIFGTILAPAFQYLGWIVQKIVGVLSYFYEAWGTLIRALGKFINLLPGSPGDPLVKYGQSVIDAAQAARVFEDSVTAAASSMSNVPEIFDLALRRRQASIGGSAVPGGSATGSGGSPGGGLTININNPPARMDVAETARQLEKAIVERLNQGGTTALSLAIQSAVAA